MKKALFILFLIIASLTIDAQVNFMGIPVDGTATEMIRKLKNKGFSDTGFTYESEGNKRPILKGNFNGKYSHIYVLTNKGKVYRVCVVYVNKVSESQIIIDFNNLFYQFATNPKYILIQGNEIDEKEDISYEMSCHNKLYDAYFYQIVSDGMIEDNTVWFRIAKHSYDEYVMSIYYDNVINEPNGEDL